MGLLNPLLPLLVRALSSRSAAIVSLALRVLTYLVQLPLPGMSPKPLPYLRACNIFQNISHTAAALKL